MDDGCQLPAGKRITETAKLYIVLSGAFVYFTSAGTCPFRNIAIRFDAALAQAVCSLLTVGTALAAGGDRGKVYRLLHSCYEFLSLVCCYFLAVPYSCRYSISLPAYSALCSCKYWPCPILAISTSIRSGRYFFNRAALFLGYGSLEPLQNRTVPL